MAGLVISWTPRAIAEAWRFLAAGIAARRGRPDLRAGVNMVVLGGFKQCVNGQEQVSMKTLRLQDVRVPGTLTLPPAGSLLVSRDEVHTSTEGPHTKCRGTWSGHSYVFVSSTTKFYLDATEGIVTGPLAVATMPELSTPTYGINE